MFKKVDNGDMHMYVWVCVGAFDCVLKGEAEIYVEK